MNTIKIRFVEKVVQLSLTRLSYKTNFGRVDKALEYIFQVFSTMKSVADKPSMFPSTFVVFPSNWLLRSNILLEWWEKNVISLLNSRSIGDEYRFGTFFWHPNCSRNTNNGLWNHSPASGASRSQRKHICNNFLQVPTPKFALWVDNPFLTVKLQFGNVFDAHTYFRW